MNWIQTFYLHPRLLRPCDLSSDVFIGFMFFFLTQHQFKMDINGAAISVCPLERFRVRFTHTLLHCSLSTLCCGGELWLKELSLLCQTVSSWKVPVWAHSPAKIRRKRKKKKINNRIKCSVFLLCVFSPLSVTFLLSCFRASTALTVFALVLICIFLDDIMTLWNRWIKK